MYDAFDLVFYTGGFALEQMWHIDKLWAVWLLAAFAGLYTVYGGLSAVAWTSSLQCILLMSGGIYVFFAGMAAIGWDFHAIVGTGQRASLMTPAAHPEVPWTAWVFMLALRDTRPRRLGCGLALPLYANLWLWWFVFAVSLGGLYHYFW